jgi:hypothetical protein
MGNCNALILNNILGSWIVYMRGVTPAGTAVFGHRFPSRPSLPLPEHVGRLAHLPPHVKKTDCPS